jgi:perosamine synthetase
MTNSMPREQRPIPVTGPWITQKEVEAVADATANAWYENATLYHTRFEKAFAAYVGRKHAIALPHCTSAIHLSLEALDLGPEDEVIVPEITWIGSSAPISYVGATPVFADVDAQTWCMDVASFERCITERTKAVILVDLYGCFPEMDQVLEIAAKRGIAVIEDAAQAIGAQYKGRKAGSFGLASAFSFHGTKLLTTGEGGMLLTDDDDFNRRCRFLADHGREPGKKLFWNTEVAYKYKMSALQAALGLAQLERIDELVERRREIFGWYREELSRLPDLTLNYEPDGIRSTFWMTTVIVPRRYGMEKEQVMEALGECGIGTRPFQYPLSSLPAYLDNPGALNAAQRNVNAYGLSPLGLNLPSGFNMDREQVRYVSNCLIEILRNSERHHAALRAKQAVQHSESPVAMSATSRRAV